MWYFEPVWKFREKGMGDQPAGGQPKPTPQPKPFHVQTVGPRNGYIQTNHTSPDLVNHLEVASKRHANGQHEHTVSIINRSPGRNRGPGLGTVSLTAHTNGMGTITHRSSQGVPTAVPVQVSDDLREMLNNHHQDHAWMPLLDKLQEDYPEQFSAHVAAHTAGRNKVTRTRATKPAPAPDPAAPTPAQPPRPTA